MKNSLIGTKIPKSFLWLKKRGVMYYFWKKTNFMQKYIIVAYFLRIVWVFFKKNTLKLCIFFKKISGPLVWPHTYLEEHDLLYAHKLLVDYGFSQVLGYINGTIADWVKLGGPTEGINGVEVDDDLDMDFSDGAGNVLMDVRTQEEWDEDGVNGVAKLLDLMNVPFIQSLDKSKLYFVYCCEGSRSLMVASYLVTLGYSVNNVIGGCDGMVSKGHKMQKYKDSQLMEYNEDDLVKWKLKDNDNVA